MFSALKSMRPRWLPRLASANRSLHTSRSYPIAINPSKSEIQAGRLTSENLEIAIRSLYHDGLVMVTDVIPHETLDHLNKKMAEDAYKLYSRKDSPFNYNPNNLQQDAPPMKEFFNSKIFMNPIATQITSTALGPCPKWTFCSGNTAMPPTSENPPVSQPVHTDADFDHPIWLGTHQDTNLSFQEGQHGERASGRIKKEELEQRRAIRPPCQPVVPKGSIVIRDLRLWHAGVGNQTDEARVMLAMIHFAPWYRNPMKLEFADDLKETIEEEKDLEIPVEWVSKNDVAGQYLNRAFGNAYDFSQGSRS
ncbi:hypothetical protein N7456_005488 [Penicillium angulare]|uniref:Phytanoyl-CoA dioxygenase n=1 Tax=Penicillium angulare TaxID=116970 RepID=A0A9W9FYP7_9EURO|nr:hypothetical protein N7456_005488 [Penicillium angulare]